MIKEEFIDFIKDLGFTQTWQSNPNYYIFYTLKFGKKCEDNPWGEGADTLEWTLPSPPAYHSFEKQPIIR